MKMFVGIRKCDAITRDVEKFYSTFDVLPFSYQDFISLVHFGSVRTVEPDGSFIYELVYE